MEPDPIDIDALFGKHFEVVIARSPVMLDAVYRLRYQVYCVERSFEKGGRHPNEREMDEFDHRSVHAALIHRASQTVCGCVRLILPGADELPIWRIAQDEQTRKALAGLPAYSTAEVSRYAVSKEFRRRSGEQDFPDAQFFEYERLDTRRVLPHITLGLMIGVATLSVEQGITHLCAVMAPALIRLLSRCGMVFTAVGSPIDYHGTRQPCVASVHDLLTGVGRKDPRWRNLIASQAGSLIGSAAHHVHSIPDPSPHEAPAFWSLRHGAGFVPPDKRMSRTIRETERIG